MSEHSRLTRARAAAADFTVDAAVGPDYCEHAQAFLSWTVKHIDPALEQEDVLPLNQAKVALLDRYFTWLDSIPKRHHSLSGRLSHACVDVVFEGAYRRLREHGLVLAPPVLVPPPPPPPPPPPQLLEGFVIPPRRED